MWHIRNTKLKWNKTRGQSQHYKNIKNSSCQILKGFHTKCGERLEPHHGRVARHQLGRMFAQHHTCRVLMFFLDPNDLVQGWASKHGEHFGVEFHILFLCFFFRFGQAPNCVEALTQKPFLLGKRFNPRKLSQLSILALLAVINIQPPKSFSDIFGNSSLGSSFHPMKALQWPWYVFKCQAPVRRSVRNSSSLKLHRTCAVWPRRLKSLGGQQSMVFPISKYEYFKSQILKTILQHTATNLPKSTSCIISQENLDFLIQLSHIQPSARCQHEWPPHVGRSTRWLERWRTNISGRRAVELLADLVLANMICLTYISRCNYISTYWSRLNQPCLWWFKA